MRINLNICLFIFIFFMGCQTARFSTSPPSPAEGQVSLYLFTESLSPSDITFALVKIEAAKGDNKWIVLFEGKKEINSINLAGHQIFLSESHIPAGRYKRIKTTVKTASLVRGEKKYSLALPAAGQEMISPVDFQIIKKESTTLFVNWDIRNSIKDKFLFRPVFLLKPQKMEMRRLLLYVTNTGSNNITVINRHNDRVVATIGVNNDPMGIVASPSGRRIYVANSGSNTISVIDTSHNRVVDTISLNFGISPRELAISPDSRRLYVSNFHSNNVSIIDTISNNLLGRVAVGNNPLGIAVNERGDRIYVANSTSNNISVIDPFRKEVIATVGAGSNPTDLVIRQDKIFIVNSGSSTVCQINIRSYRIEKEIASGLDPFNLVGGLMNRIYVANRNSNDISVIPFSMNMAIQRIAVEDFPQGMAVDRERRKLYVANGGANTVSVIGLVREKLIGSIPVGKRPYGLALIE